MQEIPKNEPNKIILTREIGEKVNNNLFAMCIFNF